MTAPSKDCFWAKVLFRDFIRHFRKMNDSQIVADVRQSMDDLEDLNAEGESFGSCMVKWAMERAETPSARASVENGKKGGRPRGEKKAEMQKLPEHLVYGQNENVFLTQEQHTELAKRLGNIKELASLLDNFSNALSDGSKKSENHFATLCNWIAYRNEKKQSGTPSNQIHFEDWNDKTARIYNETMARIESKYGGG